MYRLGAGHAPTSPTWVGTRSWQAFVAAPRMLTKEWAADTAVSRRRRRRTEHLTARPIPIAARTPHRALLANDRKPMVDNAEWL
jgi:hypothetical protein